MSKDIFWYTLLYWLLALVRFYSYYINVFNKEVYMLGFNIDQNEGNETSVPLGTASLIVNSTYINIGI